MSCTAPAVVSFLLKQLNSLPQKRPMVCGINGVQGIGKTTLVQAVTKTLAERNLVAVFLSIDDLYFPYAEQTRLAQTHAENPLLQYRGNAGTHTVELGTKTLESLCAAHRTYLDRKMAGDPPRIEDLGVKLPRYDKTAYGGRGDRVPVEAWPVAFPPVDVILFEGWMIGFQHEPSEEKILDPNLLPVNDFLKAYEPLYQTFDCFVHLDAEDLSAVYDWRLQAEKVTRQARGEQAAMTDEQVRDFVNRFMPAYQQYLPRVKTVPLLPGHQLRVVVSKNREVVSEVEM